MSVQPGSVVERLRERLGPRTSTHPASSGLVFIAVTWLPMALLALGHRLLVGEWPMVVLRFESHVRLLVAAPIVLGAGRVIHERVLWSVRQLVEGGYVRTKDLARYDAIASSLLRLRDSRVAERGIFALALLSLTWTPLVQGSSVAGLWEHFVGLTAFRFILVRALWRWLAWARFLAQVSELDLALVATHPDLGGGLVFLSQPSEVFGVFVFGIATVVAAQCATEVALTGSRVVGFENRLIAFAVLMALLALVPLLPFSTRLLRLRERALRDYGAFAQGYCTSFQERWIPARLDWKDTATPSELAPRASDPAVLRSPDIRGLSALARSFDVIAHLRPFPFDPKLAAAIAVAAFLPAVPVFLTQVPLEVIVKPLLKVL